MGTYLSTSVLGTHAKIGIDLDDPDVPVRWAVMDIGKKGDEGDGGGSEEEGGDGDGNTPKLENDAETNAMDATAPLTARCSAPKSSPRSAATAAPRSPDSARSTWSPSLQPRATGPGWHRRRRERLGGGERKRGGRGQSSPSPSPQPLARRRRRTRPYLGGTWSALCEVNILPPGKPRQLRDEALERMVAVNLSFSNGASSPVQGSSVQTVPPAATSQILFEEFPLLVRHCTDYDLLSSHPLEQPPPFATPADICRSPSRPGPLPLQQQEKSCLLFDCLTPIGALVASGALSLPLALSLALDIADCCCSLC
ncbi:hypothetical protein ACHAWF_009363 [Thalassiosira exigua]